MKWLLLHDKLNSLKLTQCDRNKFVFYNFHPLMSYLWLCYVYRKQNFGDVIQVIIQLNLKLRNDPDTSGGPSFITWTLNSRKRMQRIKIKEEELRDIWSMACSACHWWFWECSSKNVGGLWKPMIPDQQLERIQESQSYNYSLTLCLKTWMIFGILTPWFLWAENPVKST